MKEKMAPINVVKVYPRNLYIINYEAPDAIEEVLKNSELEFAIEKIIQLVVDDNNLLKGIITKESLQNYTGKGCTLDEILVSDFTSITEGEVEDEAELARMMFEYRKYYLIPVLSKQGELLYAYMAANERVTWMGDLIRPVFGFESIVAYMKVQEKRNPGCTVYICSDLGKHEQSVEIDAIRELDSSNSVVVLGFFEDFANEEAAKECKLHNIPYYSLIKPGRLSNYFLVNEAAYNTIRELRQRNGKYYEPNDMESLFQAISQTRELEGDYVEIGTYRGDSAESALEYMKWEGINRKSYFLDTYSGFDYEAARTSNDALWSDTHKDTSKELVEYRLKRYENYECIQSNIIENEIPDKIQKIACCNIDVDMDEAIAAALEKVHKRIVKNGIILAEDYGHTPGLIGGYHAIKNFVQMHKNEYIAIFGRGSYLILIRK